MSTYIHPTQEAVKRFYQEYNEKGKVVMLNLLKFKDIADYSDLDALRPSEPISGKEAYRLYMEHARPILERYGSKVLHYGNANHFLIGPEEVSWDLVIVVEYESVARFMSFAQDEEYLKGAGHRTAALADSRLLPSTQ